ncbi:hypothetical protein RAS1_21740 [Phycisphaerae bacterium RAS1]|nr:hypothetical protein RAS1_21740 [Phycisphaerae bacterium RAS1]
MRREMLPLLTFAVLLLPGGDSPAPQAGEIAATQPAAPRIAAATGAGDEPLSLVPAEAMLCWYGRPLPDARQAHEMSGALRTLLDLGTRLAGGKQKEAQLGARILEAFGLMIRYPHVLTLIDTRARTGETRPETRKVDQLRFAMMVRAGGESEAFLRIIQKVVDEQFGETPGGAKLVTRSAGRWRYQELVVDRLPEWCKLAWGKIGDDFVFAVGDGVWPQIADVAAQKKPSLLADAWVREHRGRRGEDALIEIILSARSMRERLDPFVQNRATAFFKAWEAEELDRAHWAIGLEGRALYCVAHFLIGGETTRRVYADPDFRDDRLMKVIPDKARYAIYKVPIERTLPSLFAGLVATRGDEIRRDVERQWKAIQAEYKFDAQRDILAHLGERMVLHNDPPHPLRLPIAFTTLLEIREQPETVRGALETLCRAWQRGLEKASDQGEAAGVLERDSDGVWYLQFGPLTSMAWTTTDKYIVISWSPVALRTYLSHVGDAVGKRER